MAMRHGNVQREAEARREAAGAHKATCFTRSVNFACFSIAIKTIPGGNRNNGCWATVRLGSQCLAFFLGERPRALEDPDDADLAFGPAFDLAFGPLGALAPYTQANDTHFSI